MRQSIRFFAVTTSPDSGSRLMVSKYYPSCLLTPTLLILDL